MADLAQPSVGSDRLGCSSKLTTAKHEQNVASEMNLDYAIVVLDRDVAVRVLDRDVKLE